MGHKSWPGTAQELLGHGGQSPRWGINEGPWLDVGLHMQAQGAGGTGPRQTHCFCENHSLTAGCTTGLSIQQKLSTYCVQSLVSMLGKQPRAKQSPRTMWLHVGARRQGHRQSLRAALCLLGATPGCSHLIEVGLVSSFREEKDEAQRKREIRIKCSRPHSRSLKDLGSQGWA